jgi:tRNA pseudouridine55 synthase
MAAFQSPKARLPVHGVLLLDKPAELSSNDALVQAKRLLNAKKAGHTGTLDPFATGLLPLCFGEATKFAQDLLDADKTYEAVLYLGVKTTTGDTEGEIVETCEVNIAQEEIDRVLPRFQGEIEQIPPMYSALKRDGKPLYEYARAGVTLERESRKVTIHRLEVLKYQAPYLTLRVQCSKGTYVRVLGEDIGAALGSCAHLKALRRTQVGSLGIEQAVTLDTLTAIAAHERASKLAPVDALLSSFPPVYLPDTLAERFLHGQRLALGKENVDHSASSGRVRVYRASDRCLLGTANLQEFEVLAPERLIAQSSS